MASTPVTDVLNEAEAASRFAVSKAIGFSACPSFGTGIREVCLWQDDRMPDLFGNLVLVVFNQPNQEAGAER